MSTDCDDVRRIELDKVRVEPDVQPRERLDEATIAEYTESYAKDANGLPLVDVFSDDEGRYWLADGFHRVEAAKQAGLTTLVCRVHRGGKRAAQLWAASCNADHGLRRSPEDKRRVVERLLRDEEWSKWSDRAIAEHTKTSQPFVGKLRRALGRTTDQRGSDNVITQPQERDSEPVGSSASDRVASKQRIGRDRRLHRVPAHCDVNDCGDHDAGFQPENRMATRVHTATKKAGKKDPSKVPTVKEQFDPILKLLSTALIQVNAISQERGGPGTMQKRCYQAISVAYDAVKAWSICDPRVK